MSIRVPVIGRLLIAGLLFFFPAGADAHGVSGEVFTGGTSVNARYSDGTPMSYARVKIAAPDGGPTFQSGRTDRNGRFCFYPDGPGHWVVVVDDEMGHRLEVSVPVGENLAVSTTAADAGGGKSPAPGWMGAVAGIGVIFGLTGLLMSVKRRRKPRGSPSGQEGEER